MPSGGFRKGAGRPPGIKNGEGKKKVKPQFECVECFNCSGCSDPISKRRAEGSGVCTRCNSRMIGKLRGQSKWIEHECNYCLIKYSGPPRTVHCTDYCRNSANNEKRAVVRRSDFANDNEEPLSRRVLVESGWLCAACGVDTPESLRGTFHPQAPEVDHIVPLARKGSHTYGNLQCLCKNCNLSKGTKLMSEWKPANDNFKVAATAA